MTLTHDEALVEAGAAAATLGFALAKFQNALDVLGSVTPKCACGWAQGHERVRDTPGKSFCSERVSS
jgi:hypothetical protein